MKNLIILVLLSSCTLVNNLKNIKKNEIYARSSSVIYLKNRDHKNINVYYKNLTGNSNFDFQNKLSVEKSTIDIDVAIKSFIKIDSDTKDKIMKHWGYESFINDYKFEQTTPVIKNDLDINQVMNDRSFTKQTGLGIVETGVGFAAGAGIGYLISPSPFIIGMGGGLAVLGLKLLEYKTEHTCYLAVADVRFGEKLDRQFETKIKNVFKVSDNLIRESYSVEKTNVQDLQTKIVVLVSGYLLSNEQASILIKEKMNTVFSEFMH